MVVDFLGKQRREEEAEAARNIWRRRKNPVYKKKDKKVGVK